MSKKEKIEKTNAIRFLDSSHIEYQVHEYDEKKALSAIDVASFLNEDVSKVFKTLVTIGKSKEHYVFVVPGNTTLDLKKAAKACNEKNVEMIPQKDLLPLTGYIHGGCSPLGMKKKFKTFIDISAKDLNTFFISAGKRGLQIEVNPLKLSELIDAYFYSLVEENL